MPLITIAERDRHTNLSLNQINITQGSGAFLLDGGPGREEKSIVVYYRQPKEFTRDSKILIVVPGAGRDGDEYRDAWVNASEKHGVLILSPKYEEAQYGFGDYHMGGLMQDLNLEASASWEENSNRLRLNEDSLMFSINHDGDTWLFNDFDRIFKLVAEKLQLRQETYDIFGHSAGGQILHRMVLFRPNSLASRIIAGNSGFYTLPDTARSLPFGLSKTAINQEDLISSFAKDLTILLGELDNENETGGTMLISPSADQQGEGRLARGQYFYEFAMNEAAVMGVPFNWKVQVVPGVGHDHQKMGAIAADMLYGPTSNPHHSEQK